MKSWVSDYQKSLEISSYLVSLFLELWRSKFAQSRFKDTCLAEYARVFKTVCVDAAYYKFPDQRYLENW